MTQQLDGITVIVTGAARGIGRAVAEMAVERGASVGMIDVAPEVTSVAEALATAGPTVAVRADISDRQQVTEAVETVVGELGAATGLVNNAGRNSYGNPLDFTAEAWDSVFAVDLGGAWHVTQAVLPSMVAAGTGSVVNVASIHATNTLPGMFPYAAAKAGLLGFTRSLALDLGPVGIRVNAISPGYVATRLIEEYFAHHPEPEERARVEAFQPMRRIGEPREIAEVVCFLLSDAASYVSGANWSVDGALSARQP